MYVCMYVYINVCAKFLINVLPLHCCCMSMFYE